MFCYMVYLSTFDVTLIAFFVLITHIATIHITLRFFSVRGVSNTSNSENRARVLKDEPPEVDTLECVRNCNSKSGHVHLRTCNQKGDDADCVFVGVLCKKCFKLVQQKKRR